MVLQYCKLLCTPHPTSEGQGCFHRGDNMPKKLISSLCQSLPSWLPMTEKRGLGIFNSCPLWTPHPPSASLYPTIYPTQSIPHPAFHITAVKWIWHWGVNKDYHWSYLYALHLDTAEIKRNQLWVRLNWEKIPVGGYQWMKWHQNSHQRSAQYAATCSVYVWQTFMLLIDRSLDRAPFEPISIYMMSCDTWTI